MRDGYGNKIETVASVTEAFAKARDREAREAYQAAAESASRGPIEREPVSIEALKRKWSTHIS